LPRYGWAGNTVPYCFTATTTAYSSGGARRYATTFDFARATYGLLRGGHEWRFSPLQTLGCTWTQHSLAMVGQDDTWYRGPAVSISLNSTKATVPSDPWIAAASFVPAKADYAGMAVSGGNGPVSAVVPYAAPTPWCSTGDITLIPNPGTASTYGPAVVWAGTASCGTTVTSVAGGEWWRSGAEDMQFAGFTGGAVLLLGAWPYVSA
jgi:hypothetical protein